MQQELANLLRNRLGIFDLSVISNLHAPEGYKVVCKGEDAVQRWKQLRALASESGYWPVILGNDKEADRILGGANSEHGVPMNKTLYRVATETADGWLKERREENLKELQDGWGERWREVQSEIHGEWPKQVDALKNFTIPLERAGLGPPKPKVTIGLFPVNDGWQVPAYLGFGGWNECPDPVGHVLMLKKWHEKYGAVRTPELVSSTPQA